ncbi:TPA: hypothetical protein HA251_03575 [Candidatus Woesearchaeota archaeon]|nr:hypothetical protein [Candidatus Woesearchaeota archaeon]
MNGREFLRGMRNGMKLFGDNITIIVNTIVLTIVYFFGIGITALIARLAGKKFIDKSINKRTKTYWKELGLKRRPLDDHYRQS